MPNPGFLGGGNTAPKGMTPAGGYNPANPDSFVDPNLPSQNYIPYTPQYGFPTDQNSGFENPLGSGEISPTTPLPEPSKLGQDLTNEGKFNPNLEPSSPYFNPDPIPTPSPSGNGSAGTSPTSNPNGTPETAPLGSPGESFLPPEIPPAALGPAAAAAEGTAEVVAGGIGLALTGPEAATALLFGGAAALLVGGGLGFFYPPDQPPPKPVTPFRSPPNISGPFGLHGVEYEVHFHTQVWVRQNPYQPLSSSNPLIPLDTYFTRVVIGPFYLEETYPKGSGYSFDLHSIDGAGKPASSSLLGSNILPSSGPLDQVEIVSYKPLGDVSTNTPGIDPYAPSSDLQGPGVYPGSPPIPNYNPASSPPSSPTPSQFENKPPIEIKFPDPDPITITSPDGIPTTFPGPATIKFPSPDAFAPGGSSNPSPGNSPGGLGVGNQAGGGTQFYFPPASLQGGPITITSPGNQPITIDPTGLSPATGVQPSSPFTPTQLQPSPLTSTGLTPTTGLKTTPSTSPSEENKPSGFNFPDPSNPTLEGIATGIIAIGQIVQGISKNTQPQAIASGAASGVCSTTSEGGCLGNLVNNAAKNVNNNTNNALNNLGLAGLAAALGNLLAQIASLVAQLGEILPLLNTISNNLKSFRAAFDAFRGFDVMGKAMQAITMLTVLHNAFFLSAAVKQTILQAISDWIKVFAPDFSFKDEKGNDVGLNKYVDQFIEKLADSVFGEATVKEYEQLFKAVNRIYQSAANIVMSVQMIVFSVQGALNIVGSNVASIGEALKKYGVVGHHAFPGQNENPNFFTRATSVIQGYTQEVVGFLASVAAIDMVAQSILGGRQAIDQVQQQKDMLYKEMKDANTAATGILDGVANKAADQNTAKGIAVSPGKSPTQEQYQEIKTGQPTTGA